MDTKKHTLPAVALLLDEWRGINIPRDFVQHFDLSLWTGLNSEDIEACQDPENEWYWEGWNNILDNARYEENGHVWTLYQDGCLWALCEELMSSEELENFGYDGELV